MPVFTSSTGAVADLAAEIAAALSSGSGAARASVGDRAEAFSWANGISRFPSGLFPSMVVDGTSFRVTTVAPSATPAGKVAEGAPKPTAVAVTTSAETLDKFSGLAIITLEQSLDSAGLGTAISATLIDQSLAAFCIDIGAVLTGAAHDATGTSWQEAILAGIAEVPWASLLIVSPADLGGIVSPGTSGFAVAMSQAAISVFGLGLVMLPGLPAGTAYVAAPSALTLFESSSTPAVLLDPYSLADVNKIRLISDLLAAAVLSAPGDVCAVTVAP